MFEKRQECLTKSSFGSFCSVDFFQFPLLIHEESACRKLTFKKMGSNQAVGTWTTTALKMVERKTLQNI